MPVFETPARHQTVHFVILWIMEPIPLDQWYCHRETSGLTTISYFLPEESDAKLAVLRRYWNDKISNLEHVRIHKWGGTVKKTYLEEFGSTIFFKRFSIRNPRYIHKPPRARASLNQEEKLQQAKFYTAPAIGLIEKKTCGVVYDSVLIFEEMADFLPLHHFLNDGETRDAMNLNEQRRLAFALGRLIGAWHTAGFFHGDMHSGNIMCKLENEEFFFGWIDNEEGWQYTRLPMRRRVHDLDHMSRSYYDAPATDRFRFWEAYARECGFDERFGCELMRKIAGMTKRYRARNNSR